MKDNYKIALAVLLVGLGIVAAVYAVHSEQVYIALAGIILATQGGRLTGEVYGTGTSKKKGE